MLKEEQLFLSLLFQLRYHKVPENQSVTLYIKAYPRQSIYLMCNLGNTYIFLVIALKGEKFEIVDKICLESVFAVSHLQDTWCLDILKNHKHHC